MNKSFVDRLRSMERSEQFYFAGLLMVFVGLTFHRSVFVALIVVGAIVVIESVITSYLAAWFAGRKQ